MTAESGPLAILLLVTPWQLDSTEAANGIGGTIEKVFLEDLDSPTGSTPSQSLNQQKSEQTDTQG